MRQLFLVAILLLSALPANANFGDADFPADVFVGGPRSYHDVWCRKLRNKCRVRFSGAAMFVEGQGGIVSSQFIGVKIDTDGEEHYTYLTYRGIDGAPRHALFLFANTNAYMEFLRALTVWRRQAADIRPNYRYPKSQGPQETHGRDRGANPYEKQQESGAGSNAE